jgi:hypothetical protein
MIKGSAHARYWIENRRRRIVRSTRRIFRWLLPLLIALPLVGASTPVTPVDPHPIILDAGIPPVLSGQVVSLTGKERFNDGQLNGLSFFVGEEEAAVEAHPPDEVKLLIPPDLRRGEYEIKAVKHDGKNSSVVFSQRVFIENGSESLTATNSAVIGPLGGSLTAADVTVEFPPNPSRAGVAVTAEVWDAPLDQKYFLLDLVHSPDLARFELPPVAAEPRYRVAADQLQDAFAVRIPRHRLSSRTFQLDTSRNFMPRASNVALTTSRTSVGTPSGRHLLTGP